MLTIQKFLWVSARSEEYPRETYRKSHDKVGPSPHSPLVSLHTHLWSPEQSLLPTAGQRLPQVAHAGNTLRVQDFAVPSLVHQVDAFLGPPCGDVRGQDRVVIDVHVVAVIDLLLSAVDPDEVSVGDTIVREPAFN